MVWTVARVTGKVVEGMGDMWKKFMNDNDWGKSTTKILYYATRSLAIP